MQEANENWRDRDEVRGTAKVYQWGDTDQRAPLLQKEIRGIDGAKGAGLFDHL